MFLAASNIHGTAAQSGIGLGAAIAVVLSWHRNKSILYAIVHGILSWVYIIWFALTRDDDRDRFPKEIETWAKDIDKAARRSHGREADNGGKL